MAASKLGDLKQVIRRFQRQFARENSPLQVSVTAAIGRRRWVPSVDQVGANRFGVACANADLPVSKNGRVR